MAVNGNKNWKPEKLENICAQITDGKHGDCQDESDSGFYFLSCKDVANGKLNYEGARQITEADFLDTHRRTKFAPADILITNSGTIGRMALAPNNELARRTTFQKSVAILKPVASLVTPNFLFYALKSDIRRLIEFAGGTAQKNLLLRDLRAFEVRVPPLPIQQRIAGILSAYDELIENSQRRIKILEAMARALYREWFVHFRFPGHDNSAGQPNWADEGRPDGVSATDGANQSLPRVASPLGEILQEWETKTLPECVEINPRVVVPREGEKPFVPMGCLSNNSMLISNIESRVGNSGAKFQNGDTLFARITPCLENGKTGFVQFLPDAKPVAFGSTEFMVLRSRTLTPEFVYLLARSDEFRNVAIKSMTGASGRQRVQEQCFCDFPIVQPPRPLLEHFSAIVTPSFQLIYKLHVQIQNLRLTRDLLLPRLLSGQVDVEALGVTPENDADASHVVPSVASTAP
jgi:type I restriction enzyme, S subunit